MPDLMVSRVLLPGGWASQVLLSTDERGLLRHVEPDARPTASCERVEGVALPGVPNLHSHAFQRALAGLTERMGPGAGDTFWSWRKQMYAFLELLGPDEVEAVATQLYVEMLKAGYTAVGEFHYLHHDPLGNRYQDPAEMSRRIVRAADRAGIGLTLLPVVYTASDFGGVPASPGQRRFLLSLEDGLGLLESLGPAFRDAVPEPGGGARHLGLALHSLRAVPAPSVAAAADEVWRQDPTSPIHIHSAEQSREVDRCLAWSGKRPVQWLLDHAPVDGRWCLVHATHMDRNETVHLAKSGAVAGLCPTTEANLGDGLFPLKLYLESGGALGVGSDSQVSVSPVEELRWLEYGQRLRTEERNVAAGFPHASTGRSLLEGVEAGGAQALGLPVGAIEVGKRADLLILDADHPALAGRQGDAIVDSWVFSGNTSPLRHVMVGGEWVVRDGHHPREEEILGRYREVVGRLSAQGPWLGPQRPAFRETTSNSRQGPSMG